MLDVGQGQGDRHVPGEDAGVLVVDGDDEGAPSEAIFEEETVMGSVRKEETGAEEVSTSSGRLGVPEALRVSSE